MSADDEEYGVFEERFMAMRSVLVRVLPNVSPASFVPLSTSFLSLRTAVARQKAAILGEHDRSALVVSSDLTLSLLSVFLCRNSVTFFGMTGPSLTSSLFPENSGGISRQSPVQARAELLVLERMEAGLFPAPMLEWYAPSTRHCCPLVTLVRRNGTGVETPREVQVRLDALDEGMPEHNSRTTLLPSTDTTDASGGTGSTYDTERARRSNDLNAALGDLARRIREIEEQFNATIKNTRRFPWQGPGGRRAKDAKLESTSVTSSVDTTYSLHDSPPVRHSNRLPYPVVPKEAEFVAAEAEREYWDYLHYKLEFSNNTYHRVKTLGAGTYGSAYLATPKEPFVPQNATLFAPYADKPLVLKVIKPGHKASLLPREALILKHLQGLPHCVQLLDTVRVSKGRTGFVFPYTNLTYYRDDFPTYSAADIRWYMRSVLTCFAAAHAKGIVNMDFKPLNVFANVRQRELVVGDWGLGIFYKPNSTHSWRTMTTFWKAPEVMLGSKNFHMAVDMWSVGTTFAGMIFGRFHFWPGPRAYNIIVDWIRTLGSSAFVDFLHKYDIELDPRFRHHYLRDSWYPKKEWTSYLTDANAHLVTVQAIDLIDKLLRFDPAERLSAAEALKHPYFSANRPSELEREEALAVVEREGERVRGREERNAYLGFPDNWRKKKRP
jgi:casein kinase II subunit alpha